MGLYIPNIKKPKHCTECYFVRHDQCELQDNSYAYDTFKEQRKHCQLIELDDDVLKQELPRIERLTKEVKGNRWLYEHFD